MGIRVNGPNSSAAALNGRQLKGISRLTNPRSDDPEIMSEEEDPGTRDYLGYILHVADEALRHVKRGLLHRARRRSID